MNDPTFILSPEDAEAIRGLIVEFHYLIDHGRASECLALLAPGAKLVFGAGLPNEGTIDGDAIKAFLITRQAAPVTSRHLLGPPRFSAGKSGEVTTKSVLTLFKSPSEQSPNVPAAIADLEEIYVRTADGWRLSVRKVHPVAWS